LRPRNTPETAVARCGHFYLFWHEGLLIYGKIMAEEPSLSWVSYLVS